MALQLYDTHFGEHQRISEWGMLINRRLRAFICTSCEAVVTPAAIKGHIPKHGRNSRHPTTAASSTHIEEVVVREGIHAQMPPRPTTIEAAFKGLKVFTNCYGCPQCDHIHTSRKGCLHHVKTTHRMTGPVVLEGIVMQRFSLGPEAKTGFEVIAPGHSLHRLEPMENYLAQLRSDKVASPASQVSLIPEHISPWHEFTRWPQYLESSGRDLALLSAQTARPTQADPLFRLNDAVQGYFEGAHQLIQSSCHLGLLILSEQSSATQRRVGTPRFIRSLS